MKESTTTIIKEEITLDGQILFDRPNSIIVGRIVEIREKAVKIDYAVEPVFANAGMMLTIFTYCCWIPKSLIVHDEHGGLTVKDWFARNFSGGRHIKKYYIDKDGKKFI